MQTLGTERKWDVYEEGAAWFTTPCVFLLFALQMESIFVYLLLRESDFIMCFNEAIKKLQS